MRERRGRCWCSHQFDLPISGRYLAVFEFSPIYLGVPSDVTNTMGDERTQCRLPGRLSELLDEAAEERGVFRSEVTRRALRYYVGVNPDGLEAFAGISAPGIRGIDRSNTVGSVPEAEPASEAVSVVDTAGEGGDGEQVSVSEAVDGDLEGEEVESEEPAVATDGGVYDPTEEV